MSKLLLANLIKATVHVVIFTHIDLDFHPFNALADGDAAVRVVISLEGWWICFVRDTCEAGTGCMFQK